MAAAKKNAPSPADEREAYQRIVKMLGKLSPSDLASAYLQEAVLDVHSLERRGSKVTYTRAAKSVKTKLQLISEI